MNRLIESAGLSKLVDAIQKRCSPVPHGAIRIDDDGDDDDDDGDGDDDDDDDYYCHHMAMNASSVDSLS